MNKAFYPIFKYKKRPQYFLLKEEVPRYIKIWAYNDYTKRHSGELSEIITGTNLVLEESLSRKFNLIQINGNTKQATSILPAEYQQVEYVESTGIQYIDTGIKPNSNTGINIKAITADSFIGADSIIVGSRDSSGNRCFIYLPTSSNTFAIGWNNNHIFSKVLTVNTEYNIFMNYNNDKKVYINNEQISFTFEEFVGNNYNMFLFVANNTGTPTTSFFKGKIKRCKITNETSLQRDFIPCYRKSDNEIGLYDLVTNTFFTNQGTGTFLKGSNVSVPTPDFPIPIKKVKGNANVKIQNKNLFDKDGEVTRYYINNAGQEVSGVDGDTFIKTLITENIASNYVISYKSKIGTTPYARFSFFNGDTFISRTLLTNNNASLVVPANTTKIDIRTDILETKHFEDLQIEAGTTSTSYVEHKEQNYPLTLGNIELNKIYSSQDYFFKENDKWYKHEAFKKLIFNGSENWERQSPAHINVINLFINIIPYGRAVGNSTVFCNIAKYGNAGANNDSLINVCQPNSVGGNFLIDLSLERFPDIESFKTYLQENNMELIYRLETPVDIEITDATLIEQLENMENAKTYKDITYVEATSSELPPILEVQYWKKKTE